MGPVTVPDETPPAVRPTDAVAPQPAKGGRDPRVDFLRGLSLLSIFIDHIPDNLLAKATLRNFGFSDAAELFVILAGFSAFTAYGRIFERDGSRTGMKKVLLRCAKIYGTQIGLLLFTLAVVTAWTWIYETESVILGPILRDGLKGAVRGVVLRALPTYLDILPLYIVLLAAFPLVWFGLRRSVAATLAASFVLYGLANVFQWDLPNYVDPWMQSQWYFNPFTWQIVFVAGAALALAVRRQAPFITSPPRALIIACWAYLIFAFFALDAWKLWPAPLGNDFADAKYPFALLGNEPKSFVTPWRLLHILAIAYLALTSAPLMRLARRGILKPLVACGRHSLPVFAVGCMLALLGRLVFRTAGVTTLTQIVVNGVGLSLILATGVWLDRQRKKRAQPAKPSKPASLGRSMPA